MYINDNAIEKLLKQSKQIIKNNSIKDSMSIISNLKNPLTNKKLGTEKAFKIYCQHIREIMKYNPAKHDNNIDKYLNTINDKIREAHEYV
jgi:flagellin-specific chaperone FliS